MLAALERLAIPYMVTGSLASSLQGEPRSTHDIDVVVEITLEQADLLVQEFPAPEYHFDPGATRTAIKRHGMFNLLDLESGDKVDFWPLTADAFDLTRFSRRQRVETPELALWVSAPEDTILMKLRWAKLSGGSEKQFTDALRVFEVQRSAVDMDYMNRWAAILGVPDDLARILREAGPL